MTDFIVTLNDVIVLLNTICYGHKVFIWALLPKEIWKTFIYSPGKNYFFGSQVGHQKADLPRVAGHQREVLDIQWNPFNDHIIASASEDTTVKIWRIPSGGLTEDLLDPLVDLRGHQRKVGIIRWHPTANGVIASAAYDLKIIVWNALKAKALCTIEGHRDTIFDLAFNYNGSLLATTSKDKKIRVMSPRTGKILQVIKSYFDQIYFYFFKIQQFLAHNLFIVFYVTCKIVWYLYSIRQKKYYL